MLPRFRSWRYLYVVLFLCAVGCTPKATEPKPSERAKLAATTTGAGCERFETPADLCEQLTRVLADLPMPTASAASCPAVMLDGFAGCSYKNHELECAQTVASSDKASVATLYDGMDRCLQDLGWAGTGNTKIGFTWVSFKKPIVRCRLHAPNPTADDEDPTKTFVTLRCLPD